MPLVYVDLIEGRDPEQLRSLLDTAHEALVEAFDVPLRDRYQVVSTHPAREIVAWDTGWGIQHSDQLAIVHIVSRRRTRQQKQNLYMLLAEKLQKECGLDPADLIVSITENDDEDWSFGQGRAQFLTGERPSGQNDPTIAAFERWVRDRLAETISIPEAAHCLGVSERTLQRTIQRTMGTSPIRFVQDLRIERAIHLLRTTDLSLDAISRRVGYEQATTLRTLLRRRTGKTTTALRNVGIHNHWVAPATDAAGDQGPFQDRYFRPDTRDRDPAGWAL
jgi:4-oxalocrotonate tautomerase